MPGRLDIADIDDPGQRRRPEPRDRSAASIERQMIARSFVTTVAT